MKDESKKVDVSKHHRYLADDNDHEKYTKVGLDGLLAATEKVLAVNRGMAEPDERDSLPNDRIHTVNRLLSERVKLDADRPLRTLMGRLNRARNLNPMPPDALSAYTIGYLNGNPLAPALEEVNPMHNADQQRRITKTGPGGVGDSNAITGDMQAVHASQFGFIDPISGPESEMAGVDVRLAHGARIGSDGRIYQIFRTPSGQRKWASHVDTKGKIIKMPD